MIRRYLTHPTVQLVAMLVVGTVLAITGGPLIAAPGGEMLPLGAVAIAFGLAVNSQGVPLFAGLEELDDMFIATMDEMDREVMDELSVSHPLWEFLQRQNLIEYRDSIGLYVPVRLRTKRNPTVKWMTGYDDADSRPSEALDEARYAYGHLTGRQMYNREELVKNSGPEQLIDLVEAKQEQLLADLNEEFAETIIGTQDADGRKPLGLGRIMDETKAVGGIDPTKPGFDFHKPAVIYKTGTTQFSLANEFEEGMRKLYRRVHISGGGKVLGENPKDGKGVALTSRAGYALICGEDVYDKMQARATQALRVTLDELKKEQSWGDFEMFDYNGKTVIFEPALDAKTAWLINFRRGVRVRIHRGTNFRFTDWRFLDNKVEVKYRDNLTYVCVYVKSRRANGKIVFQ